MRKIKSLGFYSILFYSILFYSILLISCDTSFNEPVREYFEYWTENVLIGRYETVSSHTVFGSQVNVSARENVRMDLILTNAKNFNLEVEEEESPCFSVLSSSGNDVASSKSISLSTPQKNVISLGMALPDETEKEILSLEGKFYIIKDSEKFEQTYSFSFRQNTPPDNPGNLRNPTEAENDGYHCMHFNYPDQSLKRHQNLTYNVSCYLFEDGAYTYIGTKSLTSSDSKSSSDFTYYFENQEKSLRYDYVVTAVNPDGLKSETISTAPNLGISYVTEPEISFSDNGTYNGLTAEKDGISYNVIEYTGSSLSATVTNTSDGADMTVKINGVSSSTTSVLADGFNTIEVTVSKNLCRPITITKNVYVIKALNEPTVCFYKHSGNDAMAPSGEAPEASGYSDYTCYDLELTQGGTGNANFEVTLGSGESLAVEIDSTPASANSGKYTLSLGPHILKLTVTKENCTPKELTKKVYIQGTLAEPEVTSSNGTKNSGSGNTAEDPQEWQFSYLSYDTMACAISAGNTDNTVSLTVDGTSATATAFTLASDSTYTLVITQTRQYCKTLETTKYVNVKIKSVKVTFQGNKFTFHGADWDSGDTIDLRGTLCAATDSTNEIMLYSWNSGHVSKSAFDVTLSNPTLYLNSPNEKFYFYSAGNMTDEDSGTDDVLGNLQKGDSSSTRKLSALKIDKSFNEVGKSTGDGYFNCTFTLVLSDN